MFSNNSYYRTDFTGAWKDNGVLYDSLSAWQAAIDFKVKDEDSISVDPLLDDDLVLKKDSPCKDGGNSRINYGKFPPISATQTGPLGTGVTVGPDNDYITVGGSNDYVTVN